MRNSTTYRAARRNAVLRGDPPQMWEGVRARQGGVWTNSDNYTPNGKRERARRARQIAAGQLRAQNGVVA